MLRFYPTYSKIFKVSRRHDSVPHVSTTECHVMADSSSLSFGVNVLQWTLSQSSKLIKLFFYAVSVSDGKNRPRSSSPSHQACRFVLVYFRKLFPFVPSENHNLKSHSSSKTAIAEKSVFALKYSFLPRLVHLTL